MFRFKKLNKKGQEVTEMLMVLMGIAILGVMVFTFIIPMGKSIDKIQEKTQASLSAIEGGSGSTTTPTIEEEPSLFDKIGAGMSTKISVSSLTTGCLSLIYIAGSVYILRKKRRIIDDKVLTKYTVKE